MFRKKLFLCFVLFIAQSILARPGKVLRCLAAEEQKFHHKRYQGPEFTLNTILVNRLASIDLYDVSPPIKTIICNPNGAGTVAERFLEQLLGHSKSIFIGQNDAPKNLLTMNLAAIEALEKDGLNILLDYISSIQALAATPDCLERHIPQLKKIKTRIRYLESELEIGQVTPTKKEITKIFKELRNKNTILNNCRKQAAAKKKNK